MVIAAADVLLRWCNEQPRIEPLLDHKLRSNPKWGSKDRRFIAQLCYDVVRNKALLQHLAPPADPDYTTPADMWQMLATWLYLQQYDLSATADRPEFAPLLHTNTLLQRHAAALLNPQLAYSAPLWLHQLGSEQWGSAKWNSMLRAMHQPATVYVRANTLRLDRNDLKTVLAKEGIESRLVAWSTQALAIEGRQNVVGSKAFAKGLCEIQDAGSQLIAPFVGARPNQTVIDACAGGGGKTLHLAALLRNKGCIIAMDTEEWKLDKLKQRAQRNGARIIETVPIVSPETLNRYHQQADCLLLDVPCSGTGTLRRKPDLKWQLTPTQLDTLLVLQQHILSVYSQMVRVGGTVVYATCSILPAENRRQVQQFLVANSAFQLVAEQFVSPAAYPCDGFYMAKMERLR